MKLPSTKIFLRASTSLALLSFVAILLPTQHTLAQPGPAMSGQMQTADPPVRAGRLAHTVGTVSFHAEGAERWRPAVVNYPVTNGYSFWTEPRAQADIEISASRVVMDGATEVDVTAIDERNVSITLAQGQLYLRLRGLAPDESYMVQTPRGVVTLLADGRYLIAAGDINNPSRVIVLQGRAQVGGADFRLDLVATQAALIEGTTRFTVRMTPAPPDSFLQAQLAREQSAPRQAATAPQIVRAMPGGDELTAYGNWQASERYGPVWYPRVEANWQPYREGRWAWVQPWGWSWVDNAPWGFAPSHYGRWVQIGSRWAWSPGVREAHSHQARPVYSPAMVSFLEVGTGRGRAGGGAPDAVAWVPLGYNEPYRPWYPVSDRYIRDVNVATVTNVNNIRVENNTVTNVTINNFANRSAVVAAPHAAMVTSADVAQVARTVDPGQFPQARIAVGQPPVAPVATTLGVTPLVARRLNLEPAQPGVVAPEPSAGPRMDRPRGRAPLPGSATDQPMVTAPGSPPTPAANPPVAPATLVPGSGWAPAVQSSPAGSPPTSAGGAAPTPSSPTASGPGGPSPTPGASPGTERGQPRQGTDGQDRRGGQLPPGAGAVPALPGAPFQTPPAAVRPPSTVPGTPVVPPASSSVPALPGGAPNGAPMPPPTPGGGPALRAPSSSSGPAGPSSTPGASPGTERGQPRQGTDGQDRRGGQPPPGGGPALRAPGSSSGAPSSTPGTPTGVPPGSERGQTRSGTDGQDRRGGQPPFPGAGAVPAMPGAPPQTPPAAARPPSTVPGTPVVPPASSNAPALPGGAPTGATMPPPTPGGGPALRAPGSSSGAPSSTPGTPTGVPPGTERGQTRPGMDGQDRRGGQPPAASPDQGRGVGDGQPQ